VLSPGNFHEYYSFNPPHERTSLLELDVLARLLEDCDAAAAAGAGAVLFVDIGCNEGDLTFAVADLLRGCTGRPVHVLGVDLDDTLIGRAQAKAALRADDAAAFAFVCSDVLSDGGWACVDKWLHAHGSARASLLR
jgi:hypothetical protein